MIKNYRKLLWLGLFLVLTPSSLIAQVPNFQLDVNSFIQPEGFSSSISLLLSLATISLIPFLMISTTAFLRIVIVLSMIRQALQTQQSPPNPVILSLAMFMTIFVMTPTIQQVYDTAVVPYQEGKLSQKMAMEMGFKPLREFMLRHAREKDIALFLNASKLNFTQTSEDIPSFVLIPAFIISELRTAFQIGFLLFIPFVVIDLIVSNILLSLGMFMLSPAMISLPFKILLFVLTDGWNLIINGVINSFGQ